MERDKKKYLELLAKEYPTKQLACREIINLNAILNLPKGTEHFMSDLHGEYEAFCHIVNNCAGVIREKVDRIFAKGLSEQERREFCTLIYYPKEKLNALKEHQVLTEDWYKLNLQNLITLAKDRSSKYTRSKVRKAMPEEFAYILDELLHMQEDEYDNQIEYYRQIMETIIRLRIADEFIIALAELIKRLAVDHLHIVGDIYDRGPHPDKIMDLLMNYHSLDIQWGNHDVLWMGAASGVEVCVAAVVRNNMRYGNIEVLESGYGISLRTLVLFAERQYPADDLMEAALQAISVLQFKLEGQLIARHPEYRMDDRRLLERIDYDQGTVEIAGKKYAMSRSDFPTVDRADPYRLTSEERELLSELCRSFRNSGRLRQHIRFLCAKGSMYRCYNENLLYHGCIPLDEQGNFEGISIGDRIYKGKEYLDYADRVVRKVCLTGADQSEADFMWYLWAAQTSPLSGRTIKTFEKMYLTDKEAAEEPRNPYYEFYNKEYICNMILREFGLYSPMSHIINGHTPVEVSSGEAPVRANGKLIIIDGGFCKAYHKKTGIAGYTLIYNSHCMRLKAHQPFESIQKVLEENKDIESSTDIFETEEKRIRVKDTDIGKKIQEQIADLELLL
ncbi:MAG: fructose-1,6-bisphosphatase [Lachnospiraceae bacterium]|nr:fructose-1,6-bisphosphatase [Lachnospiraceae bacterium]MDE7434881.1 fructose-1,6-bisphosphatase [Lachnospiraceae bacterium]